MGDWFKGKGNIEKIGNRVIITGNSVRDLSEFTGYEGLEKIPANVYVKEPTRIKDVSQYNSDVEIQVTYFKLKSGEIKRV